MGFFSKRESLVQSHKQIFDLNSFELKQIYSRNIATFTYSEIFNKVKEPSVSKPLKKET